MRTRPTYARLAAALAAVLFAFACASAQEGAADDREQFEHGFEELSREKTWPLPTGTSKAEAAALNARWKALGEELKTTTSEFAGTYHDGGEMRQSFVRWAPGGGFVYLYVYERFSVLDFSYGRVEVTPTAVVFEVERERSGAQSSVRPSPTPRRWVAARWRQLNYLVPEKEMEDFGMYVGGFGDYNDFNGPCCEFTPFMSSTPRLDPQKSFEVPRVPAPYARLMRRPVEATIKSVGRRRVVKDYGMEGKLYQQWFERASLTRVTIDVGRGRGLKPGLLLRLVGEPWGQYLKVTRVLAARSEGVVIRDVDEDGGESYYDSSGAGGPQKKVYPPVRVGTRVTTAPQTY
ncbi:MAG TPA: hypothetical protein VF521_16535 [Pyrinomonadaceae bacterium]